MKIKQLIILFFISTIFFSCVKKEKKIELDGYWFVETDTIKYYQKDVGLCFYNDTILNINNEFFSPFSFCSKYKIVNDTIIFEDFEKQT